MTARASDEDIRAWFTGRLPAAWASEPPTVTVDRDEITVIVTVERVELDEGASPDARTEAAAGRIAGWREDTRDERIAVARQAEARFDRKVSWGARVGDRTALFTHLAVPAMTRLRQPERQVLDTLVEAGVARSRADALQWCVRLVGTHSEEWLRDLQAAIDQVREVREQGPG